MKKVIMITMTMMAMAVTSTMSQDDGTNVVPPCNKCLGAGQACEDPHMLGFDGKAFDIWNTGDYLVLKESDGFEISFTVRNRWGKKSSPWITEIRCRGPGGPWMKVTAATAIRNSPDGPIEATVFVDGVGAVDNGDSYTDPTTSLRVSKSLQGSSIAFVAPRWTLDVDHKIAHVRKDGWHYLNMAISITSLLETPVTGVLGVTYNPDTYARILHHPASNEASSAAADHSSSSRSLLLYSAMPRGLVIYPAADEIESAVTSTSLHRHMLQTSNEKCCNGTKYNTVTGFCCQGVIDPHPGSNPRCCGTDAYSADTQYCCDGLVDSIPCI
jgi:hypothetical protein